MTSLAIAPIMQYSGTKDAVSTPLLTVAAQNDSPAPEGQSAKFSTTKPLHSPGWKADLTHYQAQLIGAELSQSYGRHLGATSAREAARAYGRARRRPQMVSSLPRLRSIM